MRDKPSANKRRSARETILEAAKRLFLEHGFASTSVDAITVAAGVSKPTIYHYFPTKEAILEAVVQEESKRHVVSNPFRVTDDPLHDLRQAAQLLIHLALSPESLTWDRMLAGEARRRPVLGKLFFDHGPQQIVDLLAQFFRTLQAKHHLDLPDVDQAADFFFGMLVGLPLLRGQLYGEVPTVKQIKGRCQAMAERFLRAYSPTASSQKRTSKS